MSTARQFEILLGQECSIPFRLFLSTPIRPQLPQACIVAVEGYSWPAVTASLTALQSILEVHCSRGHWDGGKSH